MCCSSRSSACPPSTSSSSYSTLLPLLHRVAPKGNPAKISSYVSKAYAKVANRPEEEQQKEQKAKEKQEEKIRQLGLPYEELVTHQEEDNKEEQEEEEEAEEKAYGMITVTTSGLLNVVDPNSQLYNNTPSQVFLDLPRRPADLKRHYRQVHADADQKDTFPYDYPRCKRHINPSTRKDHYRGHLKDFHKEDIGSAKQGKNVRATKKWQEVQQAWLEERRVDLQWWRCKNA
ncbi:C2H2 finger domain-containing protein [Rutstroemia sp. NJR-2017a WRK4]|nr:C2H2 finger domain-containing protein [Rutstroemia sp. NJR-2017a WRK4]